MRSALVIIAAGLALVLSGCDEFDDPVGLLLEPDGRVVIYGTTCDEDARIVEAMLFDRDTDELLWKIRSEDGTREWRLDPGEPPAGFVVETPYQQPARDARLLAEVHIDRGDDHYARRAYFTYDELEVGLIRANWEYYPPEEWDQYITGDLCYCEPGLIWKLFS